TRAFNRGQLIGINDCLYGAGGVVAPLTIGAMGTLTSASSFYDPLKVCFFLFVVSCILVLVIREDDELIVKKMQSIDVEIAQGKRRVLSEKEALKKYR
ncbi:MAG: hypothetical protein V1911_00620, partial [Candidatus Micrarchaeota archaeon]